MSYAYAGGLLRIFGSFGSCCDFFEEDGADAAAVLKGLEINVVERGLLHQLSQAFGSFGPLYRGVRLPQALQQFRGSAGPLGSVVQELLDCCRYRMGGGHGGLPLRLGLGGCLAKGSQEFRMELFESAGETFSGWHVDD